VSYFKVGEECILQSERYPELNGDCIVLKVLDKKPIKGHFAGGVTKIISTYSYLVTIESPNGFLWLECALRKKHKPSTESLSTMIEELNKVKV
jgi:hypothetical protein